MSDENKAVMRRFIEEAINNGDEDIFDELVAPDFVNQRAHPGTPADRESWKRGFNGFRRGFPDVRLDIDQEMAEGDFVTTRFTLRGTHQDTFMGIPATGKEVAASGINIARLAGGRIVERWEVFDMLGMMRQLGAVLSPGG